MKKSWQMHHEHFCEKRNIKLSKMLTAVIIFFPPLNTHRFVSFELLILGSRHDFKLLLYWFPVATVANCHKLCGLKEHILVIVVLRIQSPKWVSLASNHSVSSMPFLLEACFLLTLRSCLPSLAYGPFCTSMWAGAGLASQRASLTLVCITPPRLRLLVVRWHWAQPYTPRHFPILRPND